LKFQAVAEKTAKDARGLLYFAAPGRLGANRPSFKFCVETFPSLDMELRVCFDGGPNSWILAETEKFHWATVSAAAVPVLITDVCTNIFSNDVSQWCSNNISPNYHRYRSTDTFAWFAQIFQDFRRKKTNSRVFLRIQK